MTTANLVGRNLVLNIDGLEEPFIIVPLAGRRGQALTATFLNIAMGAISPMSMDDALAEAAGPGMYDRVRDELTLHEGESVLLAAFYWQTVLGMDGVNAYLNAGEGLAGAKKALELLILALGISPTQTAPSGVLESLIPKLAPTPPTGRATTTLDKLPAAKRSQPRKPKTGKPAA
ncbi:MULTISPECIES: hypothetical protein [Cryobacterium]|uniref:Tail assembly chaperone n=1 Tax=Cryobacterium breve TaxID=1259258 RepID=A0ABY2J622_9MICO|nr:MULTISPECIES: hypothetical protein [Cryobacterium]TFC92039.1 hypothetical protein E3T20_12040 [Cryobacterium sp. TmT3-12]TFC99822.1 hypothetical protein E3O65_05465 [Cryobacterium breve]